MSDLEEALEAKVRRLEKTLLSTRRHGAMAVEQMYRVVRQELRAERQRARAAEKRARRAEEELAAVRASTTWRAGRAVVALPAMVRRGLRR